MTARATDDPMLRRYRVALDRLYGDRIDRVVLFGSCARGDAHAGSDYDVAVLLKTLPNRWEELDRLAGLGTDFLEETGALIDAKPYLASACARRTPLMREIRCAGVDI